VLRTEKATDQFCLRSLLALLKILGMLFMLFGLVLGLLLPELLTLHLELRKKKRRRKKKGQSCLPCNELRFPPTFSSSFWLISSRLISCERGSGGVSWERRKRRKRKRRKEKRKKEGTFEDFCSVARSCRVPTRTPKSLLVRFFSCSLSASRRGFLNTKDLVFCIKSK